CFGALPGSHRSGAIPGGPLQFGLIVRSRSIRPRLCTHISGSRTVLGNAPCRVAGEFTVSFLNPFPSVRSTLGDRPSVAKLRRMFFSIESHGFDVIAEDEVVFAVSGIINLVSQT